MIHTWLDPRVIMRSPVPSLRDRFLVTRGVGFEWLRMRKGLRGRGNTKHRHKIVPVRIWGCPALKYPATLHCDLAAGQGPWAAALAPSALCATALIPLASPWTMSLSAPCPSLPSGCSLDVCCLLVHCPQLCSHHDFLPYEVGTVSSLPPPMQEQHPHVGHLEKRHSTFPVFPGEESMREAQAADWRTISSQEQAHQDQEASVARTRVVGLSEMYPTMLI